MDRFELDPKLADEIRSRVFGEGFIKIVQSVRRNGKTFRIAMRPVEIGGERRFQAEMTDDGHVQVKNFAVQGAADGLEEIISQPGAREMHLITSSGDLHVRVTKKGRALVSRSATMERVAEVRPHDRVKNLPLTAFDSGALLKATGLADADGRLRASMRGKYDQVNEFLKVVADLVKTPPEDGAPFTVVDCGCGKAYLTLALYLYLVHVLKFPSVKVVGIDRRKDVIESARRMAAELDVAADVVFAEADLADLDLESVLPAGAESPGRARADMVVSLHACDTATDDAIYLGIQSGAKLIVVSPCCHKQIRSQMKITESNVLEPALKYGVVMERMAELLTDSLRVLILNKHGYKTKLFEFVEPEFTSKNTIITAEKGATPSADVQAKIQAQIDAIKNKFGIKYHYLEKLIENPVDQSWRILNAQCAKSE
jgi:SAM-dependent methyltransferase